MQERTIHNLSRQVLSFLCFPQFTPVDAPRSRHLSLGSEARELSENALSLERLSCTPERPLQEVAIADKETSQALPHPALHNNPSSDPSVPDSSEKETLSPRPLAVASHGTAGSPSPKWALRKPLFLVRLPAEIRALTEVELSTLQHTDMGCLSSPQLYVRMVHFFALNEETLNTYFGRYGQVGCEILRRVPLQDTDMGEAMMHALTEIFQVTVHELLVQDIIVSVDSYRNAVQATRSAYYKDDTRCFILSTLAAQQRSRVSCVLCDDIMPVFDRYPLVDGTFFLSPKQHAKGCQEVKVEGRTQYLSAVCMACLEASSPERLIRCRFCATQWDGSSLVLGTMYSYDIFAAMPCCAERHKCNNCFKPLLHPHQRLNFFSDYSHTLNCPFCHVQDTHFVKPLAYCYTKQTFPLYQQWP